MVDDRAHLAALAKVPGASDQRQTSARIGRQASNDRPDLDDGPESLDLDILLGDRKTRINEIAQALTASPSSVADSTTQSSPTDARPLRGPFSTFFPNSNESLFHTPLINQDKFDWSPTEQGHILGAFFYGYIIFQIPGARMAELVGARW